MTTISLLIGLAIGGAVTSLATRAWMTLRVNVALGERDDLRDRLELADSELETARGRAEAAEGRENELRLSFATAEGKRREQLAQLSTELEAVRREQQEKLALIAEAQQTMRAVLKDAAGEAFEGSGRKVVELTAAALKTATAENRETFERERKDVEQLVAPVKDGLTKLGAAVDKLDRDRQRQHTEFGEQMKAMVEGQTQVRNEAAVLSRALRQPHARGQWGEFHLKRVAEVAGMSSFCDFDEQAHRDDDGKVLRPDMVVNLPGGKQVVVDSKAPLNPYLEACEATDPGTRDRHMQLYARGLRAHIKKLSAKNYAAQFESAPDFVVMYLPGEHFFAAAVEVERSLIEEAVKERVLIGTPVTLIALLRTIAYAWQQEKVEETARDIAQLGRTLYERLCIYLDHVAKESRLLNSLVDAHNAGVGSLEHRVLPAARRFPELGAVGSDKQLPALKPATRITRSVQAPELANPASSDHTSANLSPPEGPAQEAA
jgi:DNA recombination protein RmuC